MGRVSIRKLKTFLSKHYPNELANVASHAVSAEALKKFKDWKVARGVKIRAMEKIRLSK